MYGLTADRCVVLQLREGEYCYYAIMFRCYYWLLVELIVHRLSP
jgi:hypothetical protein